MTFLLPILLAGLGALAIPILLHLLRRGERRTLDFPALRYLRQTTREHARTIRFRQLLLLAFRLGIIVLLALAGARLVLPLGGRDHPPAGLVLVVDNGLGSGTVVGDRRVLDELVTLGLEALERTGARDRVWVVAAGEPWAPALPLEPREAAHLLRELEPTHAAPDLDAAVARARALLRTAGPEPGQILVLSNLDAGFPTTGELPGEAGPPLLVVSPELVLPPNRGVAEVRVGTGLTPRLGDPVTIQLRVTGEPREDVAFRLHLDGDLAAAGRTGAGGMASVTLPSLPPGWVTGRVELDPDPLRADDVRHLALRVEPPPRVAVQGRISTFLEDALEVLEDGGRIARVLPRQSDVVLLGGGSEGLPAAPGTGLVLLAPDSPELLPGVNRVLALLRPGWRLEPPPGPGPGRGLVSADPRLRLPGDPEVRSAYRLVHGDDPPPRALLTLSDGTPWLVEIEAPDREALLLLSPLTPEAGEVPTSVAMIPLADFLTSAGRAASRPPEVRAGEPLALPPGAHSLRTPDGTLRPLDGTRAFPGTGLGGIYDVLDGEGELLARIPVNPVPLETGRRRTPRDAAARLGEDARGMGSRESWAREILGDRRGREVWRPLAALALLLLLVEGWYAGTGGIRSRPSSPDSPGSGP